MKIIDFVKEYDQAKKQGLEFEDKIIKDCLKNEYVLFERKVDAAQAIVDACYWKTETDERGNKRSVLQINSILKYYLTYMAILELFTTLEKSSDGKEMLIEFNLLNKRGIIKKITEYIDQDELAEFKMVLQMVCDDVVANEYENHAFVEKQIERLGGLFTYVLKPILDELDYDKIKSNVFIGDIYSPKFLNFGKYIE